MEITFQNKREDLDAFYDYLLTQTPEGTRLGKHAYKNKQLWMVMFVGLISSFFWGLTSNVIIALISIIGLLIFVKVLFLIIAGLKPNYYYGKQLYKGQEKLLTPKDLQIIQLPRTLTADEDWLEVRSTEAVHRWRWRRVDQIGITADSLYIHVGNCPVVHIPKRDFPSEQSFIEFGKKLVELKDKYKDQPLGAE
jgi:hypothetical protein